MTFDTTADADLDAMPENARPTFARLIEVAADLENKTITAEQKATAVEAAVGTVREGVAKERACRADAKCMAKRKEKAFFTQVVQPMCQADQEREGALQGIAREKANPSGYVDKVFLHSLGASAQQAQDTLTAMTPDYVKFRKHPWRGWRSECVVPDAGAP
jgi:hypothetical protein